MTDADPTTLGIIGVHRGRKAERDAPLLAKLLATGTDAGTNPVRERVEKALAELDAALAALEGEPEPEPEPESFLDAVRASQEARRRAIVDAALGRNVRMPAGATTGLDGGARQTPAPKPPTHEQTLTDVLRSGEANAGASF
jgi:hypothetical protein